MAEKTKPELKVNPKQQPKLEQRKEDGNQKRPRSFEGTINGIIREISSIRLTLRMVLNQTHVGLKESAEEFTAFMEKNSVEIGDGEKGKKTYKLDIGNIHKFQELTDSLHIASLAPKILTNATFVSLILRWDVYFSNLLRLVYSSKSEVLDSSEKAISFAELSKFSSIEEAREHVINSEIETLLRGSHEKQFEYLEKRIGIKTPKDEDIWKTFIEITERRNLIAHTDGIASSQYIEVCKRNKIDIGDTKVGDNLPVDRKYIGESCDTLTEFAAKLGFDVWRRLHKEQKKDQDSYYLSMTYALIRDGFYIVAQKLLEDFVGNPKNLTDEYIRKASYANLAQAYKWSKNQEKCVETLKREDWGHSRDNFVLVRHVLLDQFAEAAKIMRQIGSAGEVSRQDYDQWPIFKEFRSSEEYREAYQSIFGEDTTTAKDGEGVGDTSLLTAPDGGGSVH